MKFKDTEFSAVEIASKYLDGDIQSDQEWLQLSEDKQAKQAFERYQLIGGLMRDEAISPQVSIADGVMAALDKEATIFAPKFNPNATDEQPLENITDEAATNVVSFPSKVAKTAGGFAIAASVALVALIGTNNFTSTQAIAPQTLASTEAAEAQVVNQAALSEMALLNEARNAQGLPVIRTVSNQKAVPIVVNTSVTTDVNTSVTEVETPNINSQVKTDKIQSEKDSKKEDAEAKN